MPLSDDELREIGHRVRRAGAANCWTGTAGTIAADARRLVRHIEETSMDAALPVDHILRGEAELRGRRYLGDEAENDAFAVLTEEDAAEVRHETQKAADLAGDVIPAPEAMRPGTTAKFGTGAVRSDTFEEFRYDLVSPIGLREVARTCAEGAAKYDDFNWERGMPVHDLLNHALAHIYRFLAGDRSEPHLPHAAWNLLAAIHSAELWPHLNQGTLRGPGCTHPSTPPPPG
jgi:hypothetical protein